MAVRDPAAIRATASWSEIVLLAVPFGAIDDVIAVAGAVTARGQRRYLFGQSKGGVTKCIGPRSVPAARLTATPRNIDGKTDNHPRPRSWVRHIASSPNSTLSGSTLTSRRLPHGVCDTAASAAVPLGACSVMFCQVRPGILPVGTDPLAHVNASFCRQTVGNTRKNCSAKV